jgi:beta-amylase
LPKFSESEKSTKADRPGTDASGQPDTAHLLEPPTSYLEKGVDAVVGLAVKDDKLRKEVDHYGVEFVKTAALFTRGKYGALGTVALYGLASASPETSIARQAEEFALGGVRGFGTRTVLNHVTESFKSAPVKGIITGIGSRALDITVSHDTFTQPSRTLDRLNKELLDPKMLAFDAITWTAGEGLFKGANTLLKGSLSKNPLAQSISMGSSFGMVTGGSAEIVRQQDAGEKFNITKVVEKTFLEGLVMGAAGGTGHKLSPKPMIAGDNALGGEKNTSINVDVRPDPAKTMTLTLAEISALSVTKQKSAMAPEVAPAAEGAKPREFVISAGKRDLTPLRSNATDNAWLKVREVLKGEDGSESLGPKQLMFVQKLGASEGLQAKAAKADLIVTSHPENLKDSDKAKHAFPEGEGKVWLTTGKDNRILLSLGDNPVSQWRKQGFVDPVRLDHGHTTLSVMAPLLVGDPMRPTSEASKAEWKEFDRQLAEAKKLGVDSVSTDVWWGMVEPSKGKFDWSYYDKMSDHISKAGLKWVPILSFHQCGGNVGDNVSVPLPSWLWADVAAKIPGATPESVKYKSEQGNTSTEYLSLWADKHAIDRYGSVMREFQTHFADKAKDIGEVNVSLGPAGELRYPSYNSHDQNAGYPTRGALQAYSDLAQASFKDFVLKKYGGEEGVAKAWNLDGLKAENIKPPSEVTGFFERGDHFKLQYGRDFFDWYNQSLIDHGKHVMGTAVKVFGQPESAFYGIDLGAKIPGVHWRVGERQGDNINLGDRQAELTAGLIRTSRGDWDKDADGRGYRPLLSMFRELQPMRAGMGSRVVPAFTALEMKDGHDGPAGRTLPRTLATWVGQEATRQGLFIKGENALNGTLYNGESWDIMKSHLSLPKQHGDYHGLTFLRMSDVVNNDVARAKFSEMNNARNSLQSVKEVIAKFFRRSA